jgi:hypothetical protein
MIRMFNSVFQMTSFGATKIHENFVPTFKVQGEVYHWLVLYDPVIQKNQSLFTYISWAIQKM